MFMLWLVIKLQVVCTVLHVVQGVSTGEAHHRAFDTP